MLFHLQDIWPYGYMIRQRSIIIYSDITWTYAKKKHKGPAYGLVHRVFFGRCPFVNLHDSTSPWQVPGGSRLNRAPSKAGDTYGMMKIPVKMGEFKRSLEPGIMKWLVD